MHSPPDAATLEALARRFERFAIHCRATSPLYEQLSLRIAADADLLALVARARPDQPPPNQLFGAVHLLLLKGAAHPLAAFYPSVSAAAAAPGDPFPAFQDFCHEHADAIAGLMASRLTQTNEVRRCVYLLPAFTLVARQAGGRPLALVEIGASAGLNLRWRHYGYDYGDGQIYGDPAAPLRLNSVLRGDLRPPLPASMPAVAARVGLDLNPIDPRDPEATLWLRALVWPEHTTRAAMLQQALALAAADPPPLRAGDVFDTLPATVAALPADAALCIYHTHVTYQFTPADRERLVALISALAAGRDLWYLACEGIGTIDPQLELMAFQDGAPTTTLLAVCSDHGHWVEWRDPTSPQPTAGAPRA